LNANRERQLTVADLQATQGLQSSKSQNSKMVALPWVAYSNPLAPLSQDLAIYRIPRDAVWMSHQGCMFAIASSVSFSA